MRHVSRAAVGKNEKRTGLLSAANGYSDLERNPLQQGIAKRASRQRPLRIMQRSFPGRAPDQKRYVCLCFAPLFLGFAHTMLYGIGPFSNGSVHRSLNLARTNGHVLTCSHAFPLLRRLPGRNMHPSVPRRCSRKKTCHRRSPTNPATLSLRAVLRFPPLAPRQRGTLFAMRGRGDQRPERGGRVATTHTPHTAYPSRHPRLHESLQN